MLNKSSLSYYLVFGSTLILLAFGLIMVFSSSSVMLISAGASPWADLIKQGIFAVVGLFAIFFLSHCPLKFFEICKWVFITLATGLQLLLIPLGVEVGGNKNWLAIGSVIQFQPSEFAKIALAVYLGVSLSKVDFSDKNLSFSEITKKIIRAIGLGSALVALPLAIIERDMGTLIIVAFMIVGTLFLSGAPAKFFWPFALLGAGVLLITQVFGDAHRMDRITAAYFGCVDVDPKLCYQGIHGRYSLASGGLTGLGPGGSREKWNYLPAAHNDFIYAVIGEELGLVGTITILILFVVLGYGLIRIATRHEDLRARLITAAVFSWMFSQVVINIGSVLGLLPIIGVPLPFVSYGVSALLSELMAIGIVLGFARTEPGAKFGIAITKKQTKDVVAAVATITKDETIRIARKGSSKIATTKQDNKPSIKRNSSGNKQKAASKNKPIKAKKE